jgi:RNA polymerase sigma factor (TIGR02999 family)
MASPHPSDLTEQLRLAREGDRDALDAVFAAVYEELRGLAKGQRRRWEGDHTLDTTALVHEAYLKLVGQEGGAWEDRAHFFAVAAKAMRHILVNYAEARRAQKRGGGAPVVPLEDALDSNPVGPDAADEILALDEALQRLGAMHERQSRVVEARFFAGLSIDETALALDVSPATVKRDWHLASAWLQREIRTTLA